MSKEIKEKTKNLLLFCVYMALFFLLEIMKILGSIKGASEFNGVFAALQYGVCLIMVKRDVKKGVSVTLILMGISLLMVLRNIIVFHTLQPLPGLINNIFYIITLMLVGDQLRKREKEAATDVLTGLYNRRGLYKLLKSKIEEEKPFSVVYIDLYNFKFINDNYGHAYGDYLLKIAADRLRTVIDNDGTATRISGDEFVVVLNDSLNSRDTAAQLIQAISEKTEIIVNGVNVHCYLTAYAGVSSFPDDTENYEALIKYADIAAFEAANNKMSAPCFFDKKMSEYMIREMELEKLIKEGLENDYFYLVYQPQYKLENKKLRGFETLLRMKTPDGKFISPAEFIPVAEKCDLILQIDDYVLRRAMREFRENAENMKNDLTVSVNVSTKNIGNPDFPEKIRKIISETGFPAGSLEIEITEYCLVSSVDVTIDNIKKLRAMGIQVALDDFGTGYTSLNYLAKMPINLLKVDKSLVDDIENDVKSRDFVHAVISMGHLMGCDVISEGVENEGQLSILSKQECDLIQGYVWGRPLDFEAASELVHKCRVGSV